ncbi:hypothetical protein ERO13_A03G061100v2 [Gossypium hirsutum]|nr:hypothetical protein ERO13_A03G061100v2 [Gossypium hirsutum]
MWLGHHRIHNLWETDFLCFFYLLFVSLEFLHFLVGDKSASGHSLTVRETITVTRAEIEGATAYEVTVLIAAGNHRSKMGICLALHWQIWPTSTLLLTKC